MMIKKINLFYPGIGFSGLPAHLLVTSVNYITDSNILILNHPLIKSNFYYMEP